MMGCGLLPALIQFAASTLFCALLALHPEVTPSVETMTFPEEISAPRRILPNFRSSATKYLF